MKKLLSILMICMIMFSCNEADVNIEEQQIEVGINIITETESGLVISETKSSSLEGQTQDAVRNTTPACVKTLTIEAVAPNGIASKTFTFTDVIGDNDIVIADNTAYSNDDNTVDADVYMKFWGGLNTVNGTTTSISETASSDPVGNEHDGISSNVCSMPLEAKTNQTIYGVDTDVQNAFFEVYPVGTVGKITYESPIQEDVKNIIRSIPPYAVFHNSEEVSIIVAEDDSETLQLNMVTNNSRMVVTARFDDGESQTVANADGSSSTRTSTDINGGYFAKFIPTFILADGSEYTGATCPDRIATDEDYEVAWFSWSNDLAIGGASMDFKIEIYDISGSLINTIDVNNNSNLELTNGKDIWVDMIIPEESLQYDSNNIIINYNWDNEDRSIILE